MCYMTYRNRKTNKKENRNFEYIFYFYRKFHTNLQYKNYQNLLDIKKHCSFVVSYVFRNIILTKNDN